MGMVRVHGRWEMRPEGVNPCRFVKKYPERRRERFLSDDEYRRLGAAVNLHVLFYNWCRIHETIRCTPAMEAGLAKTVHDVEWIARLADSHYAE